jgi:cell division protein FtsQ
MALLLAAASLPGSALFTLRSIEVEGARTLTPDDVRAASGLSPGAQSVFTVNAQEVARRLATHPRIASARVRVRPPYTVRIQVRERVPVAAVPYERGYAVVDAVGTVVEVTDRRPPLMLVSERGRRVAWVAPGHEIPSPAVREGLAILRVMPEALRGEVAHLQVTPDREVFLYTVDGLEIRAGPLRGLRQRLDAAPEILRAVRALGGRLEYVDLSLADQIIIKPRASP